MSGTSSSFLTKSIILMGLVLLCMGTSMYFGKKLGRNIMALTRSNIEGNYPGATLTGTDDNDAIALDAFGDRSSFGYDPGEFGSNPFPQDWADPPEDEFEMTGEDPVVEITPLGHSESNLFDLGSDFSPREDWVSEPVEPEDPEEDPEPIPVVEDDLVFRIQVGIFSERDNAENEWDRLIQAGYDAHVTSYTDDDRVMYRVHVGDYDNRDESNEVAEQLRSMNFNAWVYEVQ